MAISSKTLFFLLVLISCAVGTHTSSTPPRLLRSSCLHASYPTICLRTLSTYPGPARTPADLARAAVSISYKRARRASSYLARIRARNSKKWASTIDDCLEQLSDSISELKDTVKELRTVQARSAAFRWHMSNAETWVSAALTNQDTCLDGIGEIRGRGVGNEVKRKIKNVAKVTSNALYLINRLG